MEVIVENGNKLEKKKARENRSLRKKLVEGDMRIVIEILLWENEARKNDWLKEKLHCVWLHRNKKERLKEERKLKSQYPSTVWNIIKRQGNGKLGVGPTSKMFPPIIGRKVNGWSLFEYKDQKPTKDK
jgi:hypothetical protein